MANPLVLASASESRARLLREAGVAFAVDPADIDEGEIRRSQRSAGCSAAECAAALAAAKASKVSARHPGSLVIGADQILVLGSEWFDKPADLAAARAQLRALRGHTHTLATAVCVCGNGAPRWHATAEPRLTMRDFSDRFLQAYIAAEGEQLLGCVGAYRIEGRGAQLFAAVEGDHFAIVGLPLIELLGFLRASGALAE